jgi:RHS repeat-associated protein
MTTYNRTINTTPFSTDVNYWLGEQPLYGSSRLGVRTVTDYPIRNGFFDYSAGEGKLIAWDYTDFYDGLTTRAIGYKQYELTDHLGNVRVLFGDRLTKQAGSLSPNILATNSYYPYGMLIKSLSQNSDSYRWGFQGHEQDNEIKGTGNHLRFGDYGYDTRLGRRWNLDPVDQVGISNYAVFKNNPMRFIDPTGMAMDDYFNHSGKYLGTDNTATDNVRIISQEDWDENKTEVDGMETIEHETGKLKSELFSASLIKDNNTAVLNVYDHYNPTGVKLNIIDDGNGGMQYSTNLLGDKSKINIRTGKNFELQLSDHANEIVNMFSHEESHHNDYLSDKNRYFTMHVYTAETTAIALQMQHPSFPKTRDDYRKWVGKNWMRYGPFVPIENNIMKYMKPTIPKILHLRP